MLNLRRSCVFADETAGDQIELLHSLFEANALADAWEPVPCTLANTLEG